MRFPLIITRYLLILFGWVAILFLALFVFGMTFQTMENRKINEDFKAVVSAVREFRSKEGRLPTDLELETITANFPVHYSRRDYWVNSNLSLIPKPPEGDLNHDVWTVSFWRGEWAEHYLSWNGENSLDWQSSWLRFSGLQALPILLTSIGCLAGAWWLGRNTESILEHLC